MMGVYGKQMAFWSYIHQTSPTFSSHRNPQRTPHNTHKKPIRLAFLLHHRTHHSILTAPHIPPQPRFRVETLSKMGWENERVSCRMCACPMPGISFSTSSIFAPIPPAVADP
ncbi:hypothetical protein G7K_5297-t1 [Saitoella complicata NRRL Y-17804]|uniref:Uncharacterized protein n=1 Tax=Saitoella complicata (strain BCRC 22490 / CBS 7301 / JCM 7358 / NBRC 10748 / NRRL Y-17804) TaxID=698492 RepID=A0A0E9NNB7_SAICN|nr:hypothetical protein G7K_5297-t1 [Saitoella complicata NRRL Y-17804]